MIESKHASFYDLHTTFNNYSIIYIYIYTQTILNDTYISDLKLMTIGSFRVKSPQKNEI